MPELKFDWPVVGHKNIQKFLQTAIANNSLANVYIFHGPSKVGKTFLAKNIAQSLLCEAYRPVWRTDSAPTVGQVPCGRCNSCRQFAKEIHPDFYIVEREVNEKTGKKKTAIAVAQVRELLEKVSRRAFLNSYKVVIIPEAQTLSQEASNCLLKTFEEPAPRTVIFLITPNRGLLLPTILSRSQSFKFLPVVVDEIYQYLIERGASRDAARELARAAGGRPTVARKFFEDNEAFLDYKKNQLALLRLIAADPAEQFKTIEKLCTDNKDGDILLKNLDALSGLVRDTFLAGHGRAELITNHFLANELTELGRRLRVGWCGDFLRRIEETRALILGNINPRLALENLIINI